MVFWACMDGVGAIVALTVDVHVSVMPSDACSFCLVCVSVCATTHPLHEAFGAVLSPCFLHVHPTQDESRSDIFG